jgi:hypothetical protein
MTFAHRSRALAHGLLSVMLAALAPASATEGPAAAQRCEPPTLGRDKLSVVCALDDAAAPQRIHIQVHLTGSHDDTTASMEVAIGDAPIDCDAGSKTSTEGEDGDVTLDCRFTPSVRPGAAAVLRASAKWYHAQYVGLEVNGHRP